MARYYRLDKMDDGREVTLKESTNLGNIVAYAEGYSRRGGMCYLWLCDNTKQSIITGYCNGIETADNFPNREALQMRQEDAEGVEYLSLGLDAEGLERELSNMDWR
jgi:hypothetical protein